MGASDALTLGCCVLAIVALAGLFGTLRERRKSRSALRTAQTQSDAMRELLRTVRMAESMAGLGIWQYVPSTGQQIWSDGVKRLFGIGASARLGKGDAETMLYANAADLVGQVEQNSAQIEPYMMQVEMCGMDDTPRTLALQACNMRGADGTVERVVALVRDVTDAVLLDRASRSECFTGPLRGSGPAAQLEPDPELPTPSDPLTGLSTQRAVMQQLDDLVMEAREQAEPLTVVMFDIDHFKRVNQRHGRDGGDQLLQKVARIAREQARVFDPIARVGGEEFVWVIPGAGEGMARVMSERMRLAIAKSSAVGAVGPVTISLGYAVIQPGDTPLSLFARADNALAAAMRSGHNRVRCAA